MLCSKHHKWFLISIFFAYIATMTISSFFLFTKHPCTYQQNMMIERMNKRNDEAVIVLHWEMKDHWAGWGKNTKILWAGYKDEEAGHCRNNCKFTGLRELSSTADVVLFEPQLFGRRGQQYPPLKRCGQKYMLFSYETSDYFPLHSDYKYLSHMDWRMTFESKSDVQVSFVCGWGMSNGIDAYRDPVPALGERKKFAVFVASNCGYGGAHLRTKYVLELMQYIQIDSYGKCIPNQPEDALVNLDEKERFQAKMDLFKQYKFVLAFENNNQTDYVTEKLPHAYLGQSLPVYMGADNVEEWTAGHNSIIRTDQFKSPRDLADYLIKVSENETLYNSYFEWKTQPLKESFQRHYNNCVFQAECRVCDLVRHERSKQAKLINNTHNVGGGGGGGLSHDRSLATDTGDGGIIQPLFSDYIIDDKFYLIQKISMAIIIIISILYFIIFVLEPCHHPR
ncbi:hypothetical protein SAMD00019534_054780 [Acytostelium subglobosum LB1]|uniref:hypothetical protein n=1 Tax=Acytostelium subglobosum LB1 TaxID=1410327 RepID=UPI000644D779|nr:hypothetical protein SAMD00019534_054780 [Acytostelium subglobosum LB1]GAM22303.1 hypothetical protein SAMD00019534_054780 [Acytostelium subglobosum LB1]|eukprot:XP_012754423.1 hypothetical protein SAMD00019534_054780 [Acytostelium subglobosum LB1]